MRDVVHAERKINRAILISRLNGWSIVIVALLSVLVTLFAKSLFGTVVGLAVLVAGYLELRGHKLLVSRNISAVSWLTISQWYLMAVLFAYSIINLVQFDANDPWAPFSSSFKELVLAINPDVYLVETMLKISYHAVYVSLIVAVLVYQGGLSIYYFSLKKYLYANTL